MNQLELSIATFNLKHDHIPWLSTYWSKRIEAVREFFLEESPDLVGTQELTRKTVGDMEKLLPEYGWIGQGRCGGEKGEYCAIFYKKDRFVQVDKGTFWLARDEAAKGRRDWLALFPRICTWALLEEKSTGARILLYNTHLDHISPIARRNGLLLIGRHIRKQDGKVPCLLTGDFNATPGSSAFRTLEELNVRYGLFSGNSYNLFLNVQAQAERKEDERTESGSESAGGTGRNRTYHGFRGKTVGKPLDYIFTSKEVEILTAKILQRKYAGCYPSDHFPIVMKVLVAPNGGETGKKENFAQT